MLADVDGVFTGAYHIRKWPFIADATKKEYGMQGDAMKRGDTRPLTLTEAQSSGSLRVILQNTPTTRSNSRIIPYIELYHGRTSVMETPVEHRQRAAEDERRRKAT